MKTVVITGASGVLGRALVDVSIEAGYEVLAVVHRNSPRACELEKIDHCHIIRLDLSEYRLAMEAIKENNIVLDGYELFFHLAWTASFGEGRDDVNTQLDNIYSALNAVRFAHDLGCNTFVGAGSQAEYGRSEVALSSETVPHPETGYGIAKLCAGQMTRLACEQMGMKHIWTRILSVYGPYDRTQTLIGSAIVKMMNDEDTDFTQCEQMWDYIYSYDAARALFLVGKRGTNGKVYVIGSGIARQLKEYVLTIAKVTGYAKKIGFGKRPYNNKQIMHLQADINEIKSLGFEPHTSFEEGIRKTIDWYTRTHSKGDGQQ